MGARSLDQSQSMAGSGTRTQPWLAGSAITGGPPCTAMPRLKYLGRYSEPLGPGSQASTWRKMPNVPGGVGRGGLAGGGVDRHRSPVAVDHHQHLVGQADLEVALGALGGLDPGGGGQRRHRGGPGHAVTAEGVLLLERHHGVGGRGVVGAGERRQEVAERVEAGLEGLDLGPAVTRPGGFARAAVRRCRGGRGRCHGGGRGRGGHHGRRRRVHDGVAPGPLVTARPAGHHATEAQHRQPGGEGQGDPHSGGGDEVLRRLSSRSVSQRPPCDGHRAGTAAGAGRPTVQGWTPTPPP